MGVKDTFFCKKRTLNCRGRLIDLSSPLVMGILNVTPDSFFDGGKYADTSDAIERCKKMIENGATIIDIGACSTRPGAKEISIEEELERIIPAITEIRKAFPDIIISIDTYRAKVAKKAIEAGGDLINDVSGGTIDPEMFKTVSKLKVPYVLMHIKGTPETMQIDPQYSDVTEEVLKYLGQKVSELKQLGVHDIILDPGFGFGKTLEHNYTLLNKLKLFEIFELPLMVGISRKGMINKVLKTTPSEALNGTTVVNTIALMNGADILRVHDVKEAAEAIKICSYYRSLE